MAVLLLFDVDGTLVRVPAARRACQATFRELFGSDKYLDGYDFSGQTDRIAFRDLALRAGVGAAYVDTIIDRYLQHLEREIKSDPGWTLPGVRQLLSACTSLPGFYLALGTGNVERGARAKLAAHDLSGFFPTGGFADDAEERADILAAGLVKAERHYGRSFSTVIVIGDTPNDIRAARHLGAKVVAVATGRPPARVLAAAEPDALLPDLSDLTMTLDTLQHLATTS